MSRAALYARVSTTDRGQDVEDQLRELREWCAVSGHPIVAEYIDRGISGSKGEGARPQFAAMLKAAHQRKFDVVVVWALDRFTREGAAATFAYVRQLGQAGVGFRSYQEPLLATDNEMIRDIVLAVMAAMAKQERERIVERVRAGLARAREKGTRSGRAIGRPALASDKAARVKALLASGSSIRQAAIGAGVGIGSAHRIAAEARTSRIAAD